MTGEHELLLRHFDGWARKTGRVPDLQLLDELLRLRSAYDDLPATYWPPQSIEHLLTERWPSKGPTEAPDPAVVVETLEGFVRFLRNTGRLSSGSADPSALAKEARRSAKRMAQVAVDRSSWSFTKQLLDFGRTQGLSLDDAPDEDAVQQRLNQITELWNSLPLEERLALSPRPDEVVDDRSDLSGKEAAMDRFGVDDPLIALLLTFSDRLPTGRLPDEDVVARYVAESTYAQRMLGLAEWVGEGRELTSTKVLRPALAREAYDQLGLGGWQLGQLRRRYPDERWAGVAAVGRDAWIAREMEQRWRSAADCEELHRLWLGALGCGLIVLDGKHARSSGEVPRTDEQWVNVGVRAAVAMGEALRDRPYHLAVLVFALLESYVGRCSQVSKRSMLDFLIDWQTWPSDQREWGTLSPGWKERLYEPSVEEAAGMWADTGLYQEDADSITLTPFGDVFVTAWLQYLEQVS